MLLKINNNSLSSLPKLKGQVLTIGSSGVTLRNNGAVKNVFSELKQTKKSLLKKSTLAWSTLSLLQKEHWTNEALKYPRLNKFDELFYYNGFQFFNFVNQNLISVNLPLLVEPLSFSIPNIWFSWYLVKNTNGVYLVYSNFSENMSIIIYMSYPVSNSVAFNSNKMLKILVVNNPPINGFVNVEPYYNEVFEGYQPTGYVFFSFRVVSNISGVGSALQPAEKFNFVV